MINIIYSILLTFIISITLNIQFNVIHLDSFNPKTESLKLDLHLNNLKKTINKYFIKIKRTFFICSGWIWSQLENNVRLQVK